MSINDWVYSSLLKEKNKKIPLLKKMFQGNN